MIVRFTQHVIGEFWVIFAFAICCCFYAHFVISCLSFLRCHGTCSPTHWTDATNLEFLELLAGFSSQNAGVTPTYAQWVSIIFAKHRTLFQIKQLRSRYQRFRKDYMLFTGVKNDSGLGWDDAL